MSTPSFVLLFQERPRSTDSANEAATKTATATREEPDTDIGAMAATQTFTKTTQEEPDTDPFRAGTLGLERGAITTGTATRTDSREEPDQDCSASGIRSGLFNEPFERVSGAPAEYSFVWFSNSVAGS